MLIDIGLKSAVAGDDRAATGVNVALQQSINQRDASFVAISSIRWRVIQRGRYNSCNFGDLLLAKQDQLKGRHVERTKSATNDLKKHCYRSDCVCGSLDVPGNGH